MASAYSRKMVSALPILLLFGSLVYGNPRNLLEKEIQELNSKIADTKTRINDTQSQMKRDTEQFRTYKEQTQQYLARVKAERDSLSKDYKLLQSGMDKLSGSISSTQARQREMEQNQLLISKAILSATDNLRTFLSTLPPGGTASTQIAPLEFLRSEIISKSVENSEAVERILQIYATLEGVTQSIEVFQGPSVFDQITGQVNYIQIGLGYLAIVNDAGSAGALWVSSSDSSGGAWRKVEEISHLASLRKAVKIRQGNAVPEIIELPFQHAVAQEAGE